MKTERARELYSDYAEGTLSPALQQALEQHFQADAEARADYEQFKQIYAAMERPFAAEVEVPLGFRAKVLELAAQEQARREAAPTRSFTGWFRSLDIFRQRRLTGGALAALAVVTLGGVLVHQVNTPGPGVQGTFAPFALTTIRSVTTQPASGTGTTHLFHIHLPPATKQATVMAYVLTDLNQITDSTARAQQAKGALAQPQVLTNDEELQIPVTLLSQSPAGSTLNMMVQWTPADGQPAGSQVVFTPLQSGVAATGETPVGGNFYSTVQALAAQDNVTIVADASATPNVAVTPPPASDTPQQALQAIAQQVGYHVRALDQAGTTYQITATE